jgi:hypothetical protein
LLVGRKPAQEWVTEKPAESDSFGLVFFENEESVWAKGGLGRLQHRDP